jgi:hypothetical protein
MLKRAEMSSLGTHPPASGRRLDGVKYLEAIKEVLNKGPSVSSDRHVAVEFSKAGLGHLSPVFTNVFLP